MGDETISVTCPAPLKAAVGESETCMDVLLHNHVIVTITSIHNDDPQYKLLVVQ